jgi:hypothetical protein
MNFKRLFSQRDLGGYGGARKGKTNAVKPAASERLANEFAWLESLDHVRSQRQDPSFAKLVEQRIVGRELIDLELQEVDEQIERICEAAA